MLPIHLIVEQRFAELSEEKYRKFSAALIPNINNVLGIRMPHMRSLAKEIATRPDWCEWIATAEDTYMEHIMLQGLVLSYARLTPDELFSQLTQFVPKINNWSVCDSVTLSLKALKKHPDRTWDFIQPYLASPHEYEVRFALIVMLGYLIQQERMENIFSICERVKHEGYYVRMAIAWLLATCCAHYPTETYAYFMHNTLDAWTHNKAIQKCIESYRISPELKTALRHLKKASS